MSTKNQQRVFCPGMIIVYVLTFFLLCLSLSAGEIKTQEKNTEEMASKVFDIIDRLMMNRAEGRPYSADPIALMEQELNAYIAQRIIIDKEEILKALELKFYSENKIEGRILINLKEQNLPSFLRPEMNLFFGGRLEIEEGLVRLKLTDLFLEGQRIQPMILDTIIAIGSRIQNMEVSSINDWYELPYGIINLRTEVGKVTFYFQD
jgi:hypothetical protein